MLHRSRVSVMLRKPIGWRSIFYLWSSRFFDSAALRSEWQAHYSVPMRNVSYKIRTDWFICSAHDDKSQANFPFLESGKIGFLLYVLRPCRASFWVPYPELSIVIFVITYRRHLREREGHPYYFQLYRQYHLRERPRWVVVKLGKFDNFKKIELSISIYTADR